MKYSRIERPQYSLELDGPLSIYGFRLEENGKTEWAPTIFCVVCESFFITLCFLILNGCPDILPKGGVCGGELMIAG